MQTCKFPGRLLFRLTALSLALLVLLAVLLPLLQPTLSVARAAPAYAPPANDYYLIEGFNGTGESIDPNNDIDSGPDPFNSEICTLRDALSVVNESFVPAGSFDIHTDGCFVIAVGNPTNTYVIKLPTGGYTYTLDPAQGELSLVNNTLFIIGDTATNTIIQANAAPNTANFRVFGNYGVTLTLENVTVRHGRCIGACISFASGGGGIYNDLNGSLTLDGSIVSSNTATSGGGIANFATLVVTNNSIISNNTGSSFGGGIYSSFGVVTLGQSTVSSNTVTGNGRGGGIYINGGTLDVTNNSTIANNRFPSSGSVGGGIYSSAAAVTMVNSSVISNTAGQGGGIMQLSTSTLTITNSQVSSNTSTFGGGGIYNIGPTGTVMVTNSTIKGNTTAGNGGGIGNVSAGVITVTGSSILFNTSSGAGGGISNLGTATLADTTISDNTAFTTTATLGGGGIYNGSTGFLTVTSSRILTNTANGDGSGVFNNNNSAGATNITGSCIAGNSTFFLPAAFRNNQAAQQTATGNWWGAATGPDTSGADTISGDVDTSGYLTASPFAECPTIGQGPASNAVYLPIIMTPPPGIIKGRITDATTGQPPQTYVSAYAYNATTGEPLYLEADKDGNGNYTLEVPPGSYKIEFGGNEYVYQFYNNKPTIETANIITVASGQTISNINAALVPAPQ